MALAQLPAVPGELVALGAALVTSVGYVSARRGLTDASAEALVVATTAMSVLLLLPAVLLTGGLRLTPLTAAVFVVSGVLGSGLGRFMLSYVIGLIGAGVAHAVKSASPVTAAVFAVVFLGERLTPLLGAGIVVVVLGLVLLTRADTDGFDPDAPVSATAALAALIVVWFGVTPVVRKFGLSVLGAPLLPALLVNFAAGLLVGVAISVRNKPGQLRRLLTSRARWYLLLTGVCWTTSIAAYFLALSLADAVVVVPIFNSSPLFTVLLGVLVMDEPVRRTTVLGAAVTVVGVVLITVV